MKLILKYNFKISDISDLDFHALFQTRRRDAMFVAVLEKGNKLFAIRDHLGNVPLFYRWQRGRYRFSTNLTDLLDDHCTLNQEGLKAYIAFKTVKLAPIFNEIKIVPPGSVIQFQKHIRGHKLLFQYTPRPQRMPFWVTQKKIVMQMDQFFSQACKRLIKKNKTAALMLSGGIDSALIGAYLRKYEVNIHAYTCAPWGKISSEIEYSKSNVHSVGLTWHRLVLLETNQYRDLIANQSKLYRQPHGTIASIGIGALWEKASLRNESQIFFGQNNDTLNASVPIQSLTFFFSFFPAWLRRLFLPYQPFSDITRNYLNHQSKGLISDLSRFETGLVRSGYSRLQWLALLGMYLAHSPSDGEVLSQPAINAQIHAANPFYDMDLVEFCLGIPVRHRLVFNNSSKIGIAIDKKPFRVLASKYLTRGVLKRKKGFTISFSRDAVTKKLVKSFPKRIGNITLKDIDQRYAAKTFLNVWKLK